MVEQIGFHKTKSGLIGLSSGNIWGRVDFVNTDVGYFYTQAGDVPQQLYKSTNGGEDWIMINDTIYCFVLKAYDENIFLAEEPNISSDGTIHRTTNGGQTWESFQVEALWMGIRHRVYSRKSFKCMVWLRISRF